MRFLMAGVPTIISNAGTRPAPVWTTTTVGKSPLVNWRRVAIEPVLVEMVGMRR